MHKHACMVAQASCSLSARGLGLTTDRIDQHTFLPFANPTQIQHLSRFQRTQCNMASLKLSVLKTCRSSNPMIIAMTVSFGGRAVCGSLQGFLAAAGHGADRHWAAALVHCQLPTPAGARPLGWSGSPARSGLAPLYLPVPGTLVSAVYPH